MTQPYGNYQLEIYLQGLAGVQPSLPMSFDELQSAPPSRPVGVVPTSPAAQATSAPSRSTPGRSDPSGLIQRVLRRRHPTRPVGGTG